MSASDGQFLWMKKMPYKHALSEGLLMLCTNPPEAFRISAIMAGGAFTRACLGSSNSHLKRLGELLTEVCYIHSRHNFTIDLQHVKSQYDDKN